MIAATTRDVDDIKFRRTHFLSNNVLIMSTVTAKSVGELSQAFLAKKAKILADLASPTEDYADASPKGSIDTPIIPLITEINTLPQFVTTSSCSGRISVYLEGSKDDGHVDESAVPAEGGVKATVARTGGKGGGGRWLYVSHDIVDLKTAGDLSKLVGLEVGQGGADDGIGGGQRLIRFKFEPLVCWSPFVFSSHSCSMDLRRYIYSFKRRLNRSGTLSCVDVHSGNVFRTANIIFLDSPHTVSVSRSSEFTRQGRNVSRFS